MSFLTPRADGGIVVTENSLVRAIAHDGLEQWLVTLPENDEAVSAPACAQSSSVFIRGMKALYEIAPPGRIGWVAPHMDVESEFQWVLALADSSALMTAGDTSLICYSPEGQLRWTWTLPAGLRFNSEPVVAASGVVYIQGGDRVFSVSPAGHLNWDVSVTGEDD